MTSLSLHDFGRVVWLAPDFGTYAWLTPWHPFNAGGRTANRLTTPIVEAYRFLPMPGMRDALRSARLVIIESAPGVMLLDRLRRSAPSAGFVYRQSDEPDSVGFHPAIARHEQAASHLFDLISVPDDSRVGLFDTRTRIIVQPHGVDKRSFDAGSPSPYSMPESARRVVFVGMEGLDYGFLDTASRLHPDWEFQVVGPWKDDLRRRNVIFQGVLPFSETIPFIQHADIGLNCIHVSSPHLRRHTLKVVQYTYCRLPIVAEAEVAADMPHVFPYISGDTSSIAAALDRASTFPRAAVPAQRVRSWSEILSEIVQTLEIPAPAPSE